MGFQKLMSDCPARDLFKFVERKEGASPLIEEGIIRE